MTASTIFGAEQCISEPLGALAVGLLWSASPDWRSPASWWGSCEGALWGQLPSLATMAFGIAPSVLAAL